MDIIDSMSLKNSNSQEVVDQYKSIEQYALALSLQILHEAVSQSIAVDWNIHCSGQCNQKLCREEYKYSLSWGSKRREEDFLSVPDCGSNLRWTPETPASPSHINYSKCSRRSSLSFSHDSLIGIVPAQDDSHLISGAVSHDTLVFSNEKDSSSDSNSISHRPYFNSDIYSNPFDHVKPYEGTVLQPKVILKQPMKLYPNCYIKSNGGQLKVDTILSDKDYKNKANRFQTKRRESSTVSKNTESKNERIVSESADVKKMNSSDLKLCQKELESNHTNVNKSEHGRLCRIIPFNYNKGRRKKIISEATEKRKSKCLSNNFRQTFCTLFQSKKVINDENNFVNAKNEFINASHCPSNSPESQKWGKLRPLQSAPPLNNSTKDSAFTEPSKQTSNSPGALETSCNSNAEIKNLKSNTFNKKVTQSKQSSSVRSASLLSCLGHSRTDSFDEHCPVLSISELDTSVPQASKSPKEVNARALPPLPSTQDKPELAKDLAETWKPMKYNKFDEGCDFASIIEKVKNYGWYWGPISGEAAEKVLSNEPDGSFIVRDSSDHHYIFSLTFRLNGITRHVRIEHDQGNFSFGGFTRFKSQTIVDFIEKAVEHSRSGRYLFFLHRRPVLGPMRVQLLHPVSRFKHVQSLQHLCRFIIVKRVRKDHLPDLPLPQRLKDYLNSPHYYSEQVEQCMLSSKGGRAKPAERRRRSLRPNARYTPQTSVQNPRRERTFAATLGSEVARANRFAESNQAPLPRTVNFDFSTNCQMSFASFDGRPSVNSQRKLREYHKTSSYSSLESCLNLDVSQDPCATELNNVRRYRRSFASNHQSTLEKSKNSNWNKSYFCKSASDCDLSSTYASDRGDSMNEL